VPGVVAGALPSGIVDQATASALRFRFVPELLRAFSAVA
jgi:hypothetical protein